MTNTNGQRQTPPPPTITNDETIYPLTLITLNIRSIRKKTHHIKNLVYKYKPDFIIIQETNITDRYTEKQTDIQLKPEVRNIYWNNDIHTTRSRGLAILQTSTNWTVKKQQHDNRGRLSHLEIDHEGQMIDLFNVYGPAQVDDKLGKTTTFRTLQEMVDRSTNLHKIIAGDFNNIIHPYDCSKNRNTETLDARILRKIIKKHNLQDTYRYAHPLGKEYTFTSHKGTGARLDRIYTTNLPVTDIQHLDDTLNYTDHKAVHAQYGYKIQNTDKKPTYWKLNNRLLEDEQYMTYMTEIIKDYTDNIPDDNILDWWDTLKNTIRTLSKTLGKQIQTNKRNKERQYIEILKIYKNNPDHPTATKIRDDLKILEQDRLQGSKIRCTHKMRGHVDEINDTITRIESDIHNRRKITKIKKTDDTMTHDAKEILDTFKDYYTHLYTSEGTDTQTQHDYKKYAKALTEHQRETLDQPITLAEIEQTIQSMNLNKSPGPDGLTVEFYQKFLPLLKEALLKLIQTIFDSGTLADSQKTSYITLIPKQGKDKSDPKNFRPISLLNNDYKIISKTLYNKFRQHLETLVHPDQTCNVKGRTIEQHTHFIRDFIGYNIHTQNTANILSLDQEKAFDRLEHSFLHKSLEYCNVGPIFRKWIEILYKDPSSCVIVNGTISEPFRIERSVRQGCPLSATLYIVCLENVLEKIRQDPEIIGTKIPGNNDKKLIAYADDTTLFPRDGKSIHRILETFKHFGKASGAKINVSKSLAMHLDPLQDTPTSYGELGVKWVKNIKILGITYNKSNKLARHIWMGILHSMDRKLHSYQHINANIFERAKIINTYILPKLLYYIKIYTPTKNIIQKITRHTDRFTTHNCNTIPHSILTQPTTNGGAGLHDITKITETAKLQYIQKIVNNTNPNTLAEYYLGTHLTKYKKIDHTLPHFGHPNNPAFYQACGKLIRKYPEVIKKQLKSKETYNAINTPDRRTVLDTTGLDLEIVKIGTDNIHNHDTSRHSKHITYALMYGALPTHTDTNCALCNKHIQREDRHIFIYCPMMQPIIQHIKDTIEHTTRHSVHIEIAIRHNIIPLSNKPTHDINIHLVAATRQTIWISRNKKINNETHFDPFKIFNNIIQKKYNTDYLDGEGEKWRQFNDITRHLTTPPLPTSHDKTIDNL